MVFGAIDLLAEAALLAAFDQSAQAGFGVGGHHAQKAVEIAVVEDVPFAGQRRVIVQDAGGASDAGVVAFDLQRIVEQARADVAGRLRSAGYFHRASRTGTRCRG